MEVWKKALEYEDYMIRQRRFFHRIPEPAWEEVKTTVGIQRELEKMGLHPMRFDGISGVCRALSKKYAYPLRLPAGSLQ